MKNKLLSSLLLLIVSFTSNAALLSDLVKDEISPVLVVDKQQAKLYVYFPQSNSLLTSPVLLGKLKGDLYNMAAYNTGIGIKQVTPSGTFWVNKKFSAKLNEPILSFIEGQHSFLALHPIYTAVPAERRLQRLTSTEVYDNRISNGCINLSHEFFNSVYPMLPSRSKIIILPEADTLTDDVTN